MRKENQDLLDQLSDLRLQLDKNKKDINIIVSVNELLKLQLSDLDATLVVMQENLQKIRQQVQILKGHLPEITRGE